MCLYSLLLSASGHAPAEPARLVASVADAADERVQLLGRCPAEAGVVDRAVHFVDDDVAALQLLAQRREARRVRLRVVERPTLDVDAGHPAQRQVYRHGPGRLPQL